MATIPTIQLLRNNNIYSSRADARSALELYKKDVPDGGVILARYSGTTGEEQIIKTLAGFVSNISTSENATVTIIDVEGAAENVQDAITNAINRLNKQDTAVVGQYVSSVSEENGIITVTRQELPSFGEKSNSGKAITAITQTNGLVDVQFGGVAAANVSVADEGNKFTATNVEDTLLEIKTSLDNAIGTGGSVETQITNKINALNSETVSGNGQVITAISQSNGIVSATAATLGAENVSASTIDDDGTKVAVTGDNVKAQISSLAKSIKTVSAAAKTYTISAVTPTSENVKEAFALVDEDGAQSGATINIYKDSSLVSLFVAEKDENGNITIDGTKYSRNTSGQTLIYEYLNANGNLEYAAVDLSNFLLDSEYGDGLQTNGGRISVKIDSSSDSKGFLTVGENGIKLSGVTDAINAAAASAKTKIEKTDGGSHVNLTSTTSTTDSSVTYTISESDIASATLLGAKGDAPTAETAFGYIAKEVTARTAAIEALDFGPVGGIGQVITTISQTDGQVSASAIDLTASNVKATESTGVPTAVDVTGETVSEQIASLAKSIKNVDVSEQLTNYYTKTEVDNNYYTQSATDYKIATEIQGLHAEVESTLETTTTKAIKIVQDMGKIKSITLGAFDCGTY